MENGGAIPASSSTTSYFVDGTVGLGGHSMLLLEQVPHAKLLCIDRDPEVDS